MLLCAGGRLESDGVITEYVQWKATLVMDGHPPGAAESFYSHYNEQEHFPGEGRRTRIYELSDCLYMDAFLYGTDPPVEVVENRGGRQGQGDDEPEGEMEDSRLKECKGGGAVKNT